MEWLPTARDEVLKVVWPLLSMPVPRIVETSLKVTVPVAVFAPEVGLTVAESVTVLPETADVGEAASVVVVFTGAATTVTLIALEVDTA